MSIRSFLVSTLRLAAMGASLLLPTCSAPEPTKQMLTTLATATPAPALPATATALPALSYLDVIARFDAHILRAERRHYTPNAQGALTSNKDAYSSVKFQMGMAALANYAIVHEDPAALEDLVRALDYALAHQEPDGGFAVDPPPHLPSQVRPIDRAGTTAFFLSDLGVALEALAQSPWYRQAPEAHAHRQRIEAQIPAIDAALDYLMNQQTLLRESDRDFANRLLFHALAYYSLGHHLDRPAACETARAFLEAGLGLQTPEGYFAEKGGYDTSYNGVTLYHGAVLYSLLPPEDPLRPRLWEALTLGAAWQASRILPSGEISTEGNTRVYPGGELFMGKEKRVAWSSTVKGLLWLHYVSGNAEYDELARRVENHYRQ